MAARDGLGSRLARVNRPAHRLGSGAAFRTHAPYYQMDTVSPIVPDSRVPRLLLDGMLGRLSRWLRLIGYDAAYDNKADDAALARRARAQGRILLTRDHELANRRGLNAILIESETLESQIAEVVSRVPLDRAARRPRCSVCNSPLSPVDREAVAGDVPPYILRTHSEFHECSGCGRIYWPGTHLAAIRERLRRIVDDEPSDA